jgi:transposase
MTSYTKLIDESLFNQALNDLHSIGKYAKITLRLQSIISSKENNILQTAKFLGFDRSSIARWIKRFKKYGISGLEDNQGRGRKTIFTNQIKVEIKNIIEQDQLMVLVGTSQRI